MNRLNAFVILSILSRAGNACADYALVWYGLSLVDKNSQDANPMLTAVFAGQAIGIIFFAPLISALFDRLRKKSASVTIDLLYACLLGLTALLFLNEALTPLVIFLLAGLLAPIGLVHNSGITMYALQKLKSGVTMSKLGEKFALALSISAFIGISFSGIIFELIGFEYCMLIGILTFIPILLFYAFYFDNDPVKAAPLSAYFKELHASAKALSSQRVLFVLVILLAMLNIPASVMPALSAAYLENSFPGRSDIFSIVIGSGILLAVLVTPLVRKNVESFALRAVIPAYYGVLAFLLGLMIFFDSPLLIGLMFAVNCIASAAVNITSGSLRVAKISADRVGRVNTIIAIMLFSGQLLGALCIIPMINEPMALFISLASICIPILISRLLLPKSTLNEITA